MNKILKDNKGYMLIEIVIASVIALVMAYFLIDITIRLVNNNNDYYIDSVLLADKSIVTKEIMDDINSKKLTKVEVNAEHTTATLTYDDETTKDIVIDIDNKTISYGEYKKKLSNELNIGDITINNDDSLLTILIPAYTNYSKENYGIRITVPYSEDIEITYPRKKENDITVTNITVNNTSTNTFPVGNYTVNVNCTGATATFDYEHWKLKISNVSVNENANCSPKFTTTTRTTMANYIINLLGSNQKVSSSSNNDGSTLEKINSQLDTGATSTDYRYRGIDPNNYIRFNDELWRIIGVFDQYSHGQTGQKLVKIIRNDSIGGYEWHTGHVNNWLYADKYNLYASIYHLLNETYYNAEDGTTAYWNFSKSSKSNFTSRGLNDTSRKMVENVTWYLGGYSSADVTTANMYKYERSTDTSSTYYYSGNPQTATNTPVGLMYASDYGYAAPSSCTSNLTNYDQAGCSDKNWLKQNSGEWTITHVTNTSYGVFNLYQSGSFSSDCMLCTTRPTIYLDSSVYYISGNGSKTNPYIIAM